MATQPNPVSGSLRTAPAIQHQVIAMRATGVAKRKIARELGIARNTVDAILDGSPVEQPDYTALIHSKIIPKAIARVEQVLDNDTDTARWALEHTVFRPESNPVYHWHGDLSLNQAVGMVPTSTTDSPSTPRLAVSTGTEAGTKAGQGHVELCYPTNFSQIPDSALLAELERRGYRTVAKPIEATAIEVINSNG